MKEKFDYLKHTNVPFHFLFIFVHSYKDSTQAAISIFPIVIADHELSDATLGFFLVVVEGLHALIGIPLIEQMLRTFLVLFTREQLSGTCFCFLYPQIVMRCT